MFIQYLRTFFERVALNISRMSVKIITQKSFSLPASASYYVLREPESFQCYQSASSIRQRRIAPRNEDLSDRFCANWPFLNRFATTTSGRPRLIKTAETLAADVAWRSSNAWFPSPTQMKNDLLAISGAAFRSNAISVIISAFNGNQFSLEDELRIPKNCSKFRASTGKLRERFCRRTGMAMATTGMKDELV